MKVRQHKLSVTDFTTPGANALRCEKLQYFPSPKTTRKNDFEVCLAEEERHNFPAAAVFHIQKNTAWDSEIESLTSLIKLHQNERRSAPCGQIGAATQPPQLATSPTLKKF